MMSKRYVVAVVAAFILLMFSAGVQAQKLTAKDLVNLKKMEFSATEIQAEIDASGVEAMSADDIRLLREKGLSDTLIDSLVPKADAAPSAVAETVGAEPAAVPVEPAPVAEVATPQPPVSAVAETVEESLDAPAEPAAKKRLRLFDAAQKQYTPQGADEFVQPALPPGPEAPEPSTPPTPPPPTPPSTAPAKTAAVPPPAPVPLPTPQVVEPTVPVPAPAPQPAVTMAATTSHSLDTGQTAAFNLPFNNNGNQPKLVNARVIGGNWLSINPPQATAQPGGSVSFRVQLSAANLGPGSYRASVRLGDGSSDIEYPFALNVRPSAMPSPALAQPVPGPAPMPSPVPGPAPYPDRSQPAYQGPSGYQEPWAGQHMPTTPPPMTSGFGQASPLTGEWGAVIQGGWGMQTILYLEVGQDGSFAYSVLQNNQLVEYTSGRLSAQGNSLQAMTDDGESLTYQFSRQGGQLIIYMPEWGGNVVFYPQ